MNFTELNEKFATYEDRHNKWLDSLLQGAVALQNEIVDILMPPESWSEPRTGKERPYIYLTSFERDEGGNFKILQYGDQNSNDQGVFVFGLAITFEKKPNSFPKQVYLVAVGVRAINAELQYCIWNRESEAPAEGQQWAQTVAEAASMVIESFVKFLDFDPATNFSARPKLGFV